MNIKEQLIREIEQAPEAYVMKFMQVWQFAKQPSNCSGETKLSDFFRQSPLTQLVANGELDLSRDRSLVPERFIL